MLASNRAERKAMGILAWILLSFLCISLFIRNKYSLYGPNLRSPEMLVVGSDGKEYRYDRESPFIFIGGFPRSGTTLARVLLDAHPDIRCGEETRVVPTILQLVARWNNSAVESDRLHEAGLSDQVMGDAVASFIMEIVVKHGEPAARICNKDPFTLKQGVYLLDLFPQAKFIYMIRDGRAVVHSLATRNVTISGYNLTDPGQCLSKWSDSSKSLLQQCDALGPNRCLKVRYEELVLQPRSQLERVFNYLDLPWSEEVMHHEDYINKPGGVSLSILEKSTDQVIQPINVEALSKWVGAFPENVVKRMGKIAPMLKILGYDPTANPPNYGTPDPEVVSNAKYIQNNAEKFAEMVEDVPIKAE